jgi:Tfp pilus assembly protein PilF|tara:strand:- start:931 stop:1320 length:390 start_codon:yes stop_codon:yes gene_type:complete
MLDNVDTTLEHAISAHEAGNLALAGEKYLEILNVEPKHPDANHNFGLIALKMEEAAMAVQFFKNAIEANPTITEYWVSCINTLIELKDVKNAQIALDKAKEVGHVDDVFEKLASNLNLVIKEIDEVAAV